MSFPKTYVDLDKHSFEENFREKSLPMPILERRFILERIKSSESSETDEKNRWM